MKTREFYVTLRVITEFEELDEKGLTEIGMKRILKKALEPTTLGAGVKEVRFGDVILLSTGQKNTGYSV